MRGDNERQADIIGVLVMPITFVWLTEILKEIYSVMPHSSTLDSLAVWLWYGRAGQSQDEILAWWTVVAVTLVALLLVALATWLRWLPGAAIHVVWSGALSAPLVALYYLYTLGVQ